ncbi:uncharacterized protein LOC129600369 isoform X2 [Paramacrobiotus metropolitanus]|uniref:uncharacterized protein LOC129600369 isoform X2 n=1 Tax=Paramacrobiotus metropolitanus TaxID=2943436 RepID=UPI002445BB41|nr:uncharacterized protein LOC129600369 isoform X2 [Paramacrobiotus metropolitanus]
MEAHRVIFLTALVFTVVLSCIQWRACTEATFNWSHPESHFIFSDQLGPWRRLRLYQYKLMREKQNRTIQSQLAKLPEYNKFQRQRVLYGFGIGKRSSLQSAHLTPAQRYPFPANDPTFSAPKRTVNANSWILRMAMNV